MDVAIIGGGAAGYFSAINAKENHPDARVTIFEKSRYVLAKVKISGGGRCNVTNGNTSISQVSRAYPRGQRLMKKALGIFNTSNTMDWFKSRDVPLYVQEDMRVFPVTDDSMSIIECFLDQAEALHIGIELSTAVKAMAIVQDKLELSFTDAKRPAQTFDKVIVATGGSPKTDGLDWLASLGHIIVDPVPSLFTFNMPTESIRELQGVAVESAQVSIPGTSLKSKGPVLITHWGLSGPAILRLSAFGARVLNEKNYHFQVQVNWVGEPSHERVIEEMQGIIDAHSSKLLSNMKPFGLPDRLWRHLLAQSGLGEGKRWRELGKKGLNKLATLLTNDLYSVSDKTGFKEEFVTCGGVSLDSIDGNTMQSKVCKNLYFAGEILDIDGITGGYNFQAAWTTAFIAGKLN